AIMFLEQRLESRLDAALSKPATPPPSVPITRTNPAPPRWTQPSQLEIAAQSAPSLRPGTNVLVATMSMRVPLNQLQVTDLKAAWLESCRVSGDKLLVSLNYEAARSDHAGPNGTAAGIYSLLNKNWDIFNYPR